MKGLTHFVSGVAAATFIPEAVYQGAQTGFAWPLLLGGIGGILPDTLDFKFYRFFYRHDVEINPDPARPDPQRIAEEIAGAMDRAFAGPGPVRVKLHTLRMGADLWQQYFVKFIADTGEILVRFGPLVNTGQVPQMGSPMKDLPVGRARTRCRIIQNYEIVTKVDIFDGPFFKMRKRGSDAVEAEFIPWHREWSHSLLVGLAAGALLGLPLGFWAGFAFAAGYALHIIEDQFGFLGSNLFWPLVRERTAGIHWMRSADALPNFGTVWTACALVGFNLNRFSQQVEGRFVPFYAFPLWKFLLYAFVIPLGVFALLFALIRLAFGPPEKEKDRDDATEWGEQVSA